MWYVIGTDGKEYGPVDENGLREWVAQGRVTPETRLLDAQRRQIPAVSVPGLFPMAGPGLATAAYPRMGMNPMMGNVAPKSKLAAILLAVFFGGFGVHRFYLGHNATGAAQLILMLAGFVTCGITSAAVGVWVIIDAIMIATGSLGDKNGAALV